MMKSFFALMILLIILPLARADEPDDQYIVIYNLIQQGDVLSEKGEPGPALAKYSEAKSMLKTFQTSYPELYPKVVKYRLNYLATKMAQMAAKTPPPAPKASTITNAIPASPPAAVPSNTPPVVPVAPATNTTQEPVNIPAPAPAPPPPHVETPSAVDNQIKALQDQIRSMEADKSLLEGKLKEALAARPADVDPHEMARVQAQIKDLQKEKMIW